MPVLETIRNSFGFSPPKVVASPGKPAVGTVSSPVKRYDATAVQNTVFAYLVLESGQGDEMFPIRKHVTTVGRLQNCDIRIYEETISRLHCQICVDEVGKLALQIFNPRGVRLNRQRIQKMASTSNAPNIYPLHESDILEMFTHRFRVQLPTLDEHKRKAGRKSFRLSLTKGADGSSKADLEEEEEMEPGAPEIDKENIQSEMKLASPLKQQQQRQDVFSSNKSDAPFKSRRSFTLKTPAKNTTRSGPWESEPRKKIGRQGSLSPAKKSRPAPVIETRMSILEGGQVHEIPDAGVEGMNLEEELMGISQEVDESAEKEIGSESSVTPLHPSPSVARLTQSASPRKKTKRRSSFFGRAGIFAGINFGFYPEERKDSEEEQAVESDVQVAASSLPDQLDRPVTPEPPLDSFGRPRLPRSLSSPSGYRSGSPGKRRVISLRTATLIKSGQIAHEQQKLLSPPSSPTKPAMSSLSMMVSAADTSDTSGDVSAGDVSASDEVSSQKAEEMPLPDMDEDDAEDEDEVDKSLSSLMDDMEVEEEKVATSSPVAVKANTTRRTRQSLAVISPSRKQKTSGRSRASLPAKMKNVASTDETVEKWRKERLAQIRPAKIKVVEAEADDVEMTAVDVEKVNEEEQAADSLASGKEIEKDTESRGSGMLRHMIRDSASLNSLLDEVTGQSNINADTDKSLAANLQGEGDMTPMGHAIDDEKVVSENVKSTASSPVRLKEKVLEAIPKELLQTSNKPARRSSEIKPRRRSSVNKALMTSKQARKSAGAVLGTMQESNKEVEEQVLAEAILPEGESVQDVMQSSVQLAAVQKEVSDTHQNTPLTPHLLALPISVSATISSPSPAKSTKSKKLPSTSPRKRAASPPMQVSDIEVIASRPKRAAKVAAAAAITGEGASLREREATASPQKRNTAQSSGRLRSVSKEPSSTLSLLSSDGDTSERLILDPSSPIKRTRRAAKNNAEEKIRAVLIKKPSVAALRDAKVLSEAGHGLSRANAASDVKVEEVISKGDHPMAKMPASRIPKKKKEAPLLIKSEPATRSSRSSRATKK